MRSDRIKSKIIKSCAEVIHIDVDDESHKHTGRKGTESHFKVLVVSSEFDGKNRVQRQRHIYKALDDEFKGGLHALSLRLLTPAEAQDQQGLFVTPDCGGSK